LSAESPFRIRSFRHQWTADLAVSWAFEMETMVLGWYVLTTTGSVVMLTLFASLQYVGTLLAPTFGAIGHRIGNRKLFCAMRLAYATLAVLLALAAFTGTLSPLVLLAYAATIGIVRPSDMAIRFTLIGETVPGASLMTASGIQRTTSDSARFTGYLTGAGLFTLLGIEITILCIASLYALGLAFTLQLPDSGTRPAKPQSGGSAMTTHWADLRETVVYVLATPTLLAIMYLALLVNATAFPLINGLLPIVARDVFGSDQVGLSYLAAGFAAGALAGSITLSRMGSRIHPARAMMVSCILWYVLIVVFAHAPSLESGIVLMVLGGFAQSFCIVPMSVVLLHVTEQQFRSRIMGIRIMAVYGVPVGLLCAGPLIAQYGYPAIATLYCIVGLVCTGLALALWHKNLWQGRF